jgi:hypothetical protein
MTPSPCQRNLKFRYLIRSYGSAERRGRSLEIVFPAAAVLERLLVDGKALRGEIAPEAVLFKERYS